MVEGMAELVNVRNAKMMNAIVALCPLMDAIAFHEFENLPEADIISAQQLQSTLFGQLTQVKRNYLQFSIYFIVPRRGALFYTCTFCTNSCYYPAHFQIILPGSLYNIRTS